MTTLIHDLTQAGYEVKFCGDFRGMVRLELYKEYDESFYQHVHCGFPGATRDKLEKDLIQELIRFKTQYGVADATEHDDENS